MPEGIKSVKVDEGKKEITIVMHLNKPELSKSKKSYTVATTRGNAKADAQYKGNDLSVGVNVYYKNTDVGDDEE